jgi:hypothetical protein
MSATPKGVLLSMTLQKGVTLFDTNITEAPTEWTGCLPSGRRPPCYAPRGQLTADQTLLHYTAALPYTAAIITGENPVAYTN